MRRIKVRLQAQVEMCVHRVVTYENLASEWSPDLRFFVLVFSAENQAGTEALRQSGLANIAWIEGKGLQEGDIVVPVRDKQEVLVLLREADAHHSLFMTNRCNSYCLMCSQPPTLGDDGWLVGEAIDAVRHLRKSPPVLGLTGGEPLLLGTGLRQVLNAIEQEHPTTHVEILTNGRLFSNRQVVSDILDGLTMPARWLVPLYGHCNFVHDFVVQTQGAFDETIGGLLTLQAHGQQIQLRIVLIEPVLRVLPELAAFIGRNLPFVREVALMGCEPIGFALANRELCEVNLHEWGETLERSARTLRRFSIPYLFMNAPLCALPQSLWSDAHRSISDWKNEYAAECDGCAVKESCSGLFSWYERGWKPAPIRPIKQAETIV